MQARTLTRTLLVSAALAVASSAMAQATDKDRCDEHAVEAERDEVVGREARGDASGSTSRRAAASRKRRRGPRRRARTPRLPPKEGSHCDHSGASDA